MELVEAPPEVVATYSYHKPDYKPTALKARAEWIKPPARKPLDRGEEDHQSSSHQTSTQSTPVVFPNGAFIYQQYTGWINAGGEVCLNVLMPDDHIISRNPTVASVGYNATRVWRTAWYVYTSRYGVGVVVGRGIVKAWAVDPAYLDKRSLLGQWAVDLRNGYVTYTTSIPLSWPEFVGVELCFAPYYSASYVVGANATLGFRKNAIPAAGGTYFLGIEPAHRSQNVGGVTHLLRPPIRNLILGPFSLADGYYGETLNLDMIVYVPWSAPPCPTLTVTTYVGELAQFIRDYASFAASSYNSDARQCIYDVQRSVTLSSAIVGIWYDEARARDKAVMIKVSFSHQVSEVIIYRVDISGRRFAENYIDKNVGQWQSLVLRGFFSQTARFCSRRAPQVNNTWVLVNIETYSWASKAADVLAMVTGAPRDFAIREVRFIVTPARAFGKDDSVRVYVRGDAYEEPWWLTWAFKLSQVVKTVLDFFERIPGPLSWYIDRVFNLRSLSNPDIRIFTNTDYVLVYWRAGIYDMFRQVAFEIGVSQIDRTIVIDYVGVASSYGPHLCAGLVASPMPAVDLAARFDLQRLRHWVFGMRVTEHVPFVVR